MFHNGIIILQQIDLFGIHRDAVCQGDKYGVFKNNLFLTSSTLTWHWKHILATRQFINSRVRSVLFAGWLWLGWAEGSAKTQRDPIQPGLSWLASSRLHDWRRVRHSAARWRRHRDVVRHGIRRVDNLGSSSRRLSGLLQELGPVCGRIRQSGR